MIVTDPITGEELEAVDEFILEQGTHQRRVYQYLDSDHVPVSLTGYTARAHFRRSLSDAEPTIELTTENGGIELEIDVDENDVSTGTVSLLFNPTHSAGATWSRLRGDVELINAGGEVLRLVKSLPTLSKEATK